MRLRWTAATAHVVLLSSVIVATDLSVAQAQPVSPASAAAAASGAGAETSRSLPNFVYRGVNLWPKEHFGSHPTYDSADGFTEPNPERAFKEGLHARLTDEQASATFSIERHLQGGERNVSPYISTTEDLRTAREFALGTGKQPSTYGYEFRQGADGKVRKFAVSRGIVYMIKPTRGNMVYVEDAAKREGVADKESVRTKLTQKEWAAFRRIDPQNIYAAQVYERVAEVDGSGKLGAWSDATLSRHDFTVDGKKLKSFQINESFDAAHPGFIPAAMPCSPSTSGRAKRSISLCESGGRPTRETKDPSAQTGGEQPGTGGEKPGTGGEKPGKSSAETPGTEGTPSGTALEEAEAKQVEEIFVRLAAKNGLDVIGRDGKKLSPADIHARIRGYTKLSPQAKVKLRANLKAAGSTAKGALLVAGAGLWAKGVYDAFAEDTTSLDKAAAITAIVPFVGCGTQAGASADKNRFDAEDTAACFGGDALLVSPLWPAGLVVHGARYFSQKWKEAQIPSLTVFQETRDTAWKESLEAFRSKGFNDLVKSAEAAQKQQLQAEKAVALHNAAEKIAEVERGSASAEAKRLLTFSAERTAREQIKEFPDKLRDQFDQAIRAALVERAKHYNEEFIKQQVDIERWKEDSWVSGVAGPRQSREDRQEYLDKVIQRLRDMPPPVPDEKSVKDDVNRARAALAKAAGNSNA